MSQYLRQHRGRRGVRQAQYLVQIDHHVDVDLAGLVGGRAQSLGGRVDEAVAGNRRRGQRDRRRGVAEVALGHHLAIDGQVLQRRIHGLGDHFGGVAVAVAVQGVGARHDDAARRVEGQALRQTQIDEQVGELPVHHGVRSPRHVHAREVDRLGIALVADDDRAGELVHRDQAGVGAGRRSACNGLTRYRIGQSRESGLRDRLEALTPRLR